MSHLQSQPYHAGSLRHQALNAASHNTPAVISSKQFLAGKHVTVLEHSSFLPDRAPCDFCFFSPKIKNVVNGKESTTSRSWASRVASVLKDLSKEASRKCSREWEERMRKCFNLKSISKGRLDKSPMWVEITVFWQAFPYFMATLRT